MKILASDYDGTLNYNGIDDRKRMALDKWRTAGNLFGLVSGRGLICPLYNTGIISTELQSCLRTVPVYAYHYVRRTNSESVLF